MVGLSGKRGWSKDLILADGRLGGKSSGDGVRPLTLAPANSLAASMLAKRRLRLGTIDLFSKKAPDMIQTA